MFHTIENRCHRKCATESGHTEDTGEILTMFNKQTVRLIGVALSVGAAAALGGTDFDLSRSTIDGGGVMHSTGGDFELSGTIGQPDAGVLTGGDFELAGGFWFEQPRGDCNETGGVDLLDYDDFEPCLTGPNAGVTVGCECFDVDRSGAVDLADVAVVQTTFTGQ